MMGMTENIGGLSGPIAEEMLPPLQSMGWSHNDSSFNCQDIFCNLFEDIGPPPDWLPPPPLPPYLLQLLNENHSLIDEGTNDCNFCHVFSNPTDSELVVTKPEFKTNDYWFSLLLGSIIGSTILCIILLFILFKFRKWKLFPSSVCGLDSCPIFLESMNKGLKDAPPPCAPSDNCILPVVNEKSPQSVITSCPTKTSISSKYWRRNEENPGSRDGRVDSRGADMEEYTNIPDGGSCTSSSVYAELDAAGVTINHSQIPSSLLLNEPSPYVFHTYSEIADAMRMAALDSSTALLPDVSYDNVAYLPSSNSDHYQNRSLRRQRSGLGHLGSAAPLLHTHQQMIIGSQMNFATGGQPHKKPRPVYSHHTSRINARNHQEQLQQQQQQQLQQLQQQQQQQQMQMQMQSEIDARYMSARRSEAVYSDFPRNSPSLATFQVPYAANFRENPKRPLPAVPGVRL